MALVLIFILGLIVGSFISAFSWRYPKKISIVKGRSICPNCKHKIRWFDNIPLISYILLGGKCRDCHKHISIRYPLIEFFTGVGFLYLWSTFVINPAFFIFYLVIYSLLVLIFVVDFENQLIPDSFVFFGIVLSLLFYIFIPGYKFLFSNLSSGFLAASLLMVIHLATFGRGMGLGDVKFAILGGMIIGINLMSVWLFTSFLTGGLAGFILILTKRAQLKSKIAFGPFLVIGLAVTFIYGNQILNLLGFF